jgi:hypothetical protein
MSGIAFLEPGLEVLDPRLDAIDVPGGDLQGMEIL